MTKLASRFVPLNVNYPRTQLPLAASVYGVRFPQGTPGLRVSFDGAQFRYVGSGTAGYGGYADPAEIARQIARRQSRTTLARLYWWSVGLGLLFALWTAEVFVVALVAASIASYFFSRWDRERRTTRILYDLDHPEVLGRLALCNAVGEALARTQYIWHVTSANGGRQRGVPRLLGRTAARITNDQVPDVEINTGCWSIGAGFIRLFLLPDQLLVWRNRRWWPLSYASLEVIDGATRILENEVAPSDASVVDYEWLHERVRGGPDLRFKHNPRLPICLYGELSLRTYGGDELVLHTSNAAAVQQAAAALRELIRINREPAPTPWSAPQWPPRVPERAAPLGVPEVPSPGARSPRATPPPPPAKPPPVPLPISAEVARIASESVPAPLPIHPHAPALPSRNVTARPPSPPRMSPADVVAAVVRTAPPPAARLPPPVPTLRSLTQRSEPATADARFLAPTEPLTHAGRTISEPFTYVSARADSTTDASTIVTTLPVGDGRRALPMPYWPRYSDIDPDQRARYLDWMAGGRADPAIPLGYVFIFFYGLERRVLVERLDHAAARREVGRLLTIHGESSSFRRYASDFLTFSLLREPDVFYAASAEEVGDILLPLLGDSETAAAALAAWHHVNRVPLPAEYAALFVRSMETARRGVAVTKSAAELLALFRLRYTETFGEGVLLEAAKRQLRIAYHPASATLPRGGIEVEVPDVFKKVGQFSRVVKIWNDCVDSLRKSASRRREGALDAIAWAAMPAELRAEIDHPDQDAWDSAVAKLPLLADFHLTTIGSLSKLSGVEARQKLTPGQLRKIGQRAADVGFAIEPEPRLRSSSIDPSSEVLVWRTSLTALPDSKIHASISAMLSLTMTVAMADGTFAPEESAVIDAFLAEMFALDDTLRSRVEAMKQLVVRDPSRIGGVAKALRAGRSSPELNKLAHVLVAIAAADGVIAETEERALVRLFAELGLPRKTFEEALARTGARLERDRPVEVSRGQPAPGAPIPSPLVGLKLDRAAIDAIMADTKDVAAILAEVFDANDEATPSGELLPVASQPLAPAPVPRASEAMASRVVGLDVRYQAALEELLAKQRWSLESVREVSTRHRLLPGALLDGVNTWSDENLGDFLIEESDGWTIHRELLEVQT